MLFLVLVLVLMSVGAFNPKSRSFNNVILYDGVCNFCNTWVDLCLRADKEGVFKYAALQSTTGGDLLESLGKERNDISSVVLVKQDKFGNVKGYAKSEAAVQVIKELDVPAFSPLVYLLSTLLPMKFKNRMYEEVAKRRYDFMGKRSTMERLDELSVKNADRFLP